VLGLATSYPWLLLSATFAGIGNSIFHPSDFTLLNQRVTQPRWSRASGAAACVFGLADVTMRTIGFFFPTDRLDVRLAFWLPLSSLVAIPFITVIAHTFLVAIRGEEVREATDSQEERSNGERTETIQ